MSRSFVAGVHPKVPKSSATRDYWSHGNRRRELMQHARRLQRFLRHTTLGTDHSVGVGVGVGVGSGHSSFMPACLSACLSFSPSVFPLLPSASLAPEDAAFSTRTSLQSSSVSKQIRPIRAPWATFPHRLVLARHCHDGSMCYFTFRQSPSVLRACCSQWLLASARAAKYPTAKWHALSRTHSSAAAAAHTHSTRITAVQMCHTPFPSENSQRDPSPGRSACLDAVDPSRFPAPGQSESPLPRHPRISMRV
jgi:hypothetical protein